MPDEKVLGTGVLGEVPLGEIGEEVAPPAPAAPGEEHNRPLIVTMGRMGWTAG